MNRRIALSEGLPHDSAPDPPGQCARRSRAATPRGRVWHAGSTRARAC